MPQVVSASNVDALKQDAERAHEVFSKAHAQHAHAEGGLGKAAGVRSRLGRGLEDARRSLQEAKQKAIHACIEGAGFEEAAAKVTALQGETDLIEQALRQYHSHAYQGALQASLQAKLIMLEAQVSAEQCRLARHVAEIEMSLAPIAARNGGLQIEMSGAVRGHEVLIATLRRDADSARAELEAAIAARCALRDEYEKMEAK